MSFDNRFVAELPGDNGDPLRQRQVKGACWSHAAPTPVAQPRLLAHSREVAALLGFDDDDVHAPWFAEVFGGNRVVPGMQPMAACYGGHQFGNWAGQLGDGRAMSLGELVTPSGQRQELQLKGAGLTPYSRRGDGRAVLRSSIREFLCSEAMHHLGVPTTRALSLVLTGDAVERDMLYDGNAALEPGAIVCRVAPSFLRFGNYEILAARSSSEEGGTALLARLVDFTIDRDFPEIAAMRARGEASVAEQREAFFAEVCSRTAHLMAHWMRVGFVHGVMNTDNMSVLGLTIDYGPYGWIDDYDVGWTPNTTDAGTRRYRFGQQPDIALWNLTRFAQALLPLFPDEQPLERGLQRYQDVYRHEAARQTAMKLGVEAIDEDADAAWLSEGFNLLQEAGLDMTLFFRGLADVDVTAPSVAPLRPAFYSEEQRTKFEPALSTWLTRWAARVARDDVGAVERRARMNRANPRYVLRNYLAQEAIDAATPTKNGPGDPSLVHALLEVLRRPYDDQPEQAARFGNKRPEWARTKVGCSMLSCSS